MSVVLAVIDLGTNTFHLLIAEVDNSGSWKKVLKERITVKLGQGGIDRNIIAPAPYKRGIKAIEKFHIELKRLRIKKIVAIGTAALRNADNGVAFRNEIKKKTGIDITFISGSEEATLIYLGVKQALPNWDDVKLVMDIGGGSVEFIIANSKKILWKKSYKLGAALLLDKFNPGDPLKKVDLVRIKTYISEQLSDLFVACNKFQPQQLIGSAGSFETFATMIKHRFPNAGSHYGKTAHPVSIVHFKQLYKELIVSDKEQRNKMKGLIKMRVDMIVVAALILKFVLDKSHIKSMKLSAYSLKEGVMFREIK